MLFSFTCFHLLSPAPSLSLPFPVLLLLLLLLHACLACSYASAWEPVHCIASNSRAVPRVVVVVVFSLTLGVAVDLVKHSHVSHAWQHSLTKTPLLLLDAISKPFAPRVPDYATNLVRASEASERKGESAARLHWEAAINYRVMDGNEWEPAVP